MESIPDCPILKFHADTLQHIRKHYGLDKQERMNESIQILKEWLQKQEHFVVKCFNEDYLERLLINNKGSVEKCKSKLDKLCTLRTFLRDFFAVIDVNKELFSIIQPTMLPDMTPDYGRVIFLKVIGKHFNSDVIGAYFRYFVNLIEYNQAYDYCYNLSFVVDWADSNVLAFVGAINFSDIRTSFEVAFEGLSMRLKFIHMVSKSKTVDAAVAICKQVLRKKLSDRIVVHSTIDAVCEHIPKELLPLEYGGKAKSIKQLTDELAAEISSSKFVTFRKEMNKACTNEALRPSDKFNEEYMGMSGTFRTLNVD